MYINKQQVTKSTSMSCTLYEHPCYDSYDDGYANFDSIDDFDLKAWGKGACLHTYRTERRSGGQRSAGGVYSTKHIRLAETRRNKCANGRKQSHNHNLNKYDLKKSWKKTKGNVSGCHTSHS